MILPELRLKVPLHKRMRRLLTNILPEKIKVKLRYIFLYWCKERKAEKNIFKIYSNFVSEGDLVFDIGANKGTMTKMFLKLGAKVVCVEPNPYCIKILKRKFGDNKDVIIVGKGLSNKRGKLRFFICSKANEISTFSKEWKKGRYSYQEWDKEAIVPVTTLERLIKQYGTPEFCKIDVEGYEPNVLRGLKSKISFISFEFHKEALRDAKTCLDLISYIGKANFNFSTHEGSKLNSKVWLGSKELLRRLKSAPDDCLRGDIYAKME